MSLRHHIQHPALILVAAIVAVSYGIYRTGGSHEPAVAAAARRAPSDRAIVVDQSSLVTAEQLVRMPTTIDERPYAEDALRLADKELDLAFASAVRRLANRPRSTSPEAKEAQSRLEQALRALDADQAKVAELTAAIAKAKATDSLTLSDRLDLAKAQTVLDQDQVDDARQDLRRAGGDPQGQMQRVMQEHDAASKSSDTIHIIVTDLGDGGGLVRQLQTWQALRDKRARLDGAKHRADSLAIVFKQRHDRVEARAAARLRDSSLARVGHDSAAVLLAAAQRRALDGQIRASLDQRIDDQHALSAAYAGWIGVVEVMQRARMNHALRGAAQILVILLIATLAAAWIEHRIGERALDRRRTQTLYMVTRVSLQVLAVLLILLVLFGPPDNLGTFLGLAGAGLTVALKDFLIAFLGWFVLMGRNGIRIGDLVEINGVTGEVVQLGMFYTVLLETGGWSEAGRPTGRRVTFTNGFAIEGHYFNFSTAGRWLWDDVRVVVPTGHDPYAIAETLQHQVETATAESAREAEAQWSEVRRLPKSSAPSVRPSVSLKPVPGGVELTARYITRASEREALRGTLYHAALELLGAPASPPRSATAAPSLAGR